MAAGLDTHHYPPIQGTAVETVTALLARERLMNLGVNRPDGWPQVTTVGYFNEGLNLYFVTGRESQKLANLKADPRVSLAIHTTAAAEGAVGVSMSGHAREVVEPAEIERLNRMIFDRWPTVSVYCPATSSVAVLRIKPELICMISARDGRSQSECFSLGDAAGLPASVRVATSTDSRLF